MTKPAALFARHREEEKSTWKAASKRWREIRDSDEWRAEKERNFRKEIHLWSVRNIGTP